ncbi:hypothetical protein E2C01_031028 [Portunus trituberculatus]|uniref:Uncharacterized protein n=1 Tax=Portunus trituberculatus TaxID=210409 RepID=A0A5B7ETE8_PORTR|nr:hypothetical protein [Portunus trituberculatus]
MDLTREDDGKQEKGECVASGPRRGSVNGKRERQGSIMGRKRESEGNPLMKARVKETETCSNTDPSKLHHETQEGAADEM